MKQRIILIDSNNIAYTAFYALPDTIATSSGIMTNAVLGFINMLLKLIEDLEPDTVICTFDSKGPTFRHKMFEEYKMHRKKMPDELAHQLPLIKEVMEAFNIKCLEKEGMEADDILASIARGAAADYGETIIVTGDKDMLQMVSERIKVLSSRKSITDTIIYDKGRVIEKMGVEPGKVKDLLALMGDNSDNIPGVPGIGPKTAVKLIGEFGSLEDIYDNIGKIKSEKLRKTLAENRNLAMTCKELATLKDDIEIDPEVFRTSFRGIEYDRVKKIFERLEFNNLVRRLPKYVDIMDFKEGSGGESKVEASKIMLKPLGPNTDIKSIALNNDKTAYIKTLMGENKAEGIILYFGGSDVYLVDHGSLKEEKKRSAVRDIIEDVNIKKSGLYLKQAIKFLKKYNIIMNGRINDFEIMYLALNPLKASADIIDISRDLLNIEIDSIEFKGKGNEDEKKGTDGGMQMTLDLAGDEGGSGGEGLDTDSQKYGTILKSFSVYKKIEDALAGLIKKNGLSRVYSEIEEPLIKVFAEMEYIGVSIDKDYLGGLIMEYDIEIKRLTEDIYKLCGEIFNINSPQQLAEILYDKLKLPVLKKTKTGLSTDAGTLKAIQDRSPAVGKILEYREKNKLKNTYIDVLPGLIDPEDGRIHTSYNQMGTSTGRISSSDPNLQNIPVRTEYGKQIRKAFIPGENYDLLMASDYSQIELRILAHLSGDQNLIDSFNRDEDIHSRTAAEVFGAEYGKVPEDLRRKAKAINFGIIYGMTEFGLASRLAISGDEARDYIKKYFGRYPQVDEYLKSLIDSAREKGYSTTMFGRKRYIRELGSSNGRLRSLGERLAVNTPIQGSAADIMKLSTTILHGRLEKENIDSNIILHVHDELVLELKREDRENIERITRQSMEECMKLKVRLKVDIKTGKNWYI
ncbi:MAG: DNA polymerase I [Actinomycetia bacterium]|nr:DNA polymerase I [Actinomycetes bacterium]